MSSAISSPHSSHKPSKSKSSKRWFPLESNPALLNTYISNLGLDTSQYQFVDVFSTEEWALGMIPQPVLAVLMLYPITPNQERFRQQEEEKNTRNDDNIIENDVWYTKQRIGNACGTIGILHALANLGPYYKSTLLASNSWMDRFLQSCPTTLSPEDKALILEEEDGVLARELEQKHDTTASDSTNQTKKGALGDDINTHFVALVNVKNGLYELDGRKKGPIRHGDTSTENFLRDACRVVKGFMERDPEEVRFTILALAPTMT